MEVFQTKLLRSSFIGLRTIVLPERAIGLRTFLVEVGRSKISVVGRAPDVLSRDRCRTPMIGFRKSLGSSVVVDCQTDRVGILARSLPKQRDAPRTEGRADQFETLFWRTRP